MFYNIRRDPNDTFYSIESKKDKAPITNYSIDDKEKCDKGAQDSKIGLKKNVCKVDICTNEKGCEDTCGRVYKDLLEQMEAKIPQASSIASQVATQAPTDELVSPPGNTTDTTALSNTPEKDPTKEELNPVFYAPWYKTMFSKKATQFGFGFAAAGLGLATWYVYRAGFLNKWLSRA